ncbi:MAG: GIY-YIG nuclease family protein [Candidatus Thiodiazotropha sp.]
MQDVPDPVWFVYILHCADSSLYTGVTTDVARRIDEHNRGQGAKYTRGRRPVELVYLETCGDRCEALKREYAIKQMPRTGKDRLIASGSAAILHSEG